ncbi:hypothetical protein C8R32_10949 [Nitrosospira sp. Nsp5]|uniref:Transposase n=1 Tax=Nitrosospira multiformis TaxID=1231 RepID=A0ABY0TI80_9PROT|nr:hypothetical protein C8R32_10949 [Nitrosospira sp. Nsp5]SDQ87667.1 hypothetical protein SAMN05216402_2648 [Nitrosospira multiformis]
MGTKKRKENYQQARCLTLLLIELTEDYQMRKHKKRYCLRGNA